jgi:hypothetical protein
LLMEQGLRGGGDDCCMRGWPHHTILLAEIVQVILYSLLFFL